FFCCFPQMLNCIFKWPKLLINSFPWVVLIEAVCAPVSDRVENVVGFILDGTLQLPPASESQEALASIDPVIIVVSTGSRILIRIMETLDLLLMLLQRLTEVLGISNPFYGVLDSRSSEAGYGNCCQGNR